MAHNEGSIYSIIIKLRIKLLFFLQVIYLKKQTKKTQVTHEHQASVSAIQAVGEGMKTHIKQ